MRFSVERTVVGSVSTEVVVHNGPGTCGFSFNLGERYLVYARRDASTGEWSTSICTRTQPLESARARLDLAYLDRPPARGGRIGGIVQEVRPSTGIAPSSRPLAGVRVSLLTTPSAQQFQTATRLDGSYELTGVPVGSYRVVVNLPDEFASHTPQQVTIGTSDGCADADIWARLDGHISGRVVDERGQAARGVHVQLADAQAIRNNTPTASLLDVQADENGVFTFRYVPDGTYVLGVGLRTPPASGQLDRRRFYERTTTAHAANEIVLGRGEHLTVPEFRLAPLPQERAVTVIVRAPTAEVASRTRLFVTGATKQPIEHGGRAELRLPYGAEFVIEANAPDGYRVSSPSSIWVRRDDAGRVLEFSIVAQ